MFKIFFKKNFRIIRYFTEFILTLNMKNNYRKLNLTILVSLSASSLPFETLEDFSNFYLSFLNGVIIFLNLFLLICFILNPRLKFPVELYSISSSI